MDEPNPDNQPASGCDYFNSRSRAQLARMFTYQKPATDEVRVHHEAVNALILDTAARLCALVPEGRQCSLMLTALEEVRHRANAGIALEWPHRYSTGELLSLDQLRELQKQREGEFTLMAGVAPEGSPAGLAPTPVPTPDETPEG